MGRIVGKLIEINRFPVKSMAGETMAAAEIDWQGIEGDRQYAFTRAANRTRFPWMTGRQVSRMVTISARYRDPNSPRNSRVEIRVPGEPATEIEDPAIGNRLAAEAGEPVTLIQLGRGTHDAMPVSIITTASL